MKIILSSTKKPRLTIQQQIVKRSFLKVQKEFATAQEIYEHCRQIIPTITMGTVYRNLEKLVRAQEVVEIHLLPRRTVFGLKGTVDRNLIFFCEDCDEIQTFSGFSLPEMRDVELQKNVKVNRAVNVVYGLCQFCKGKAR
ncbi:MAG: transcriptional repressor [bacterium]